MAKKIAKEECMSCDKEFEIGSKGSILGEIHYGKIKNKSITKKEYPFHIDHEHICLCPKCAKAVIEFMKNLFGKRSPTSTFWKIGR